MITSHCSQKMPKYTTMTFRIYIHLPLGIKNQTHNLILLHLGLPCNWKISQKTQPEGCFGTHHTRVLVKTVKGDGAEIAI